MQLRGGVEVAGASWKMCTKMQQMFHVEQFDLPEFAART
jgi:hypothetical protein